MTNTLNKLQSIPLLMTLGIKEASAKILLTLIENGPCTVSKLSKKLLLSRTTTYEYLRELESENLIHRQNNSLAYQSINLDTLTSKIDRALFEAQQSLSSTIKNASSKDTKPKIEIHAGNNAISNVYEDIGLSLPKGGIFYRYTSRKEDHKKNEIYSELRVKKEIERLVITSAEKASKKQKDSNRFIKIVPKEFAFDDNVSLIIYNNKIVHIDHIAGSAITITSQSMARFQEKIFKILWRQL